MQRENSRSVVIIASQLGQRGSCLRRVEGSLLDGLLLIPSALLIFLFNCLFNLLTHYTLKTCLELAAAVCCQATVGAWNVVPEEEEVQQYGDDETQGSNHPDDQGEQHGKVNDRLLLVAVFNHELDVEEELLETGAFIRRMVADGKKLSLHDGIQSHGIDGDTWPLSDDDEQGTLELEVDEEGNVVGALFTLGQLGKDQEAPPALSARRDAHTL